MLLIAVQPSAQGQNTYTEGSSQGKEPATVLDKVQYRVTYAARLVVDTTKVDSLGGYDYSDDEMRLDIGQSANAISLTCRHNRQYRGLYIAIILRARQLPSTMP